MQPIKITFERRALKTNLELLSMAQTPKPVIPIMDYMKIVVKSKNIILISTSSEISMKMFVGTANVEDFSAIIDPKAILSLLSKTTEANIMLEFTETGTTLYEGLTGEYYFPLPAKPDEFPVFPKADVEATKITIQGNQLKKAMSNAAKFIGHDTSRAFLNGVSMACPKKYMEIVASDGHILHVKHIGHKAEGFIGVIWSARVAALLNKLLIDMPVILTVNNANTVFQISNTTVIHVRNLEGKMVDYWRIVDAPDNATDKITVDRIPLMEMIDKASVVSNIIDFELKGSILNLSASKKETSQKAGNKLAITRQSQENLIIRFNSVLLLPILQIIDEEKITLELYKFGQNDIKTIIYRDENSTYLLSCIDPQKS